MKKNKIMCILLVIILIFGNSIISMANNEKNEEINPKDEKENKNIIINTDTNDLNDLNNQRNQLQERINEINGQLEYVQGEISQAVLKVQKIDDKIAIYEAENQELNNKILNFQKSINENSILLEEVSKQYKERDELLKARLVAMYQEGEISYLDMFLSAKNVSDFLYRYYIVKEITEYDNKLIDEVAQKKRIIENTQKKLEKETEQVKLLKAKAEQTQVILTNAKTLQQGQIELLSNKEKELNEKILKYKIDNIKVEAKMSEISLDIHEFQIQYTGRRSDMASSNSRNKNKLIFWK